MSCPLSEICGGCSYRDMDISSYRQLKQHNFNKTVASITDSNFKISDPIFIEDGCRRRATLTFEYKKKKLILGFNQESSHKIIDINNCPLLTPAINNTLSSIRKLLEMICSEGWNEKKGKKIITHNITNGDVFVCEADNGLDIVLEYNEDITLFHRMIISEIVQSTTNVIRISHRRTPFSNTETIIEKTKPYIKMGKYDVYVPAGTFLQPSHEGQQVLSDLVMKYMKGSKGQVADLFCGVGTFSYLLADIPDIKITAIDSSETLLKGFQSSINYNKITNIKTVNKNLFKYPLDSEELKSFSAILFDPPRAGARAVCQELANSDYKPEIVVAISCNPSTFVNDANILISGGYKLIEITMVDQFIYSNHSELVAFFTK